MKPNANQLSREKPPIVLLTDFGLGDPYAGIMKGVIHSIVPKVTVIDLTHQIEPQNLLQAALVLEGSYPYFPKGSVFVCVVDPGVGTKRKILCAKTEKYYFLAPNNGILGLALERETDVVVRSVENNKYFLPQISSTFHGRDIFSPVAAHLANDAGVFAHLGPETSKFSKLKYPEIDKHKNELKGEILCFDHFGNAVTNLRSRDAGDGFWNKAEVIVDGRAIGRLQKSYQPGGRLIALLDSFSRLEIAFPGSSARDRGRLKIGSRVVVRCV